MKTNFKLVRIDDTYSWNFDKEQMNTFGKIYCVYLYNANQTTNCCELTPSYYLIPLYYYPENQVSDSMLDLINDNASYDGIYMHYKHIDKLPEQIEGEKYGVNGEYSNEEEENELNGKAEEYFKCNWQL